MRLKDNVSIRKNSYAVNEDYTDNCFRHFSSWLRDDGIGNQAEYV